MYKRDLRFSTTDIATVSNKTRIAADSALLTKILQAWELHRRTSKQANLSYLDCINDIEIYRALKIYFLL